MDALYELMGMLPKTFEPPFTERLNKFYHFLCDQKPNLSEEEARKLFLNNTKSKRYFNKLKQELKRKMIRYIIENPTVWADATYQSLHQACYKDFATYKVLLLGGKRKAAIEIAKALVQN